MKDTLRDRMQAIAKELRSQNEAFAGEDCRECGNIDDERRQAEANDALRTAAKIEAALAETARSLTQRAADDFVEVFGGFPKDLAKECLSRLLREGRAAARLDELAFVSQMVKDAEKEDWFKRRVAELKLMAAERQEISK